MARTLSPDVVAETLAELGIRPHAYAIENRGKRLTVINKRGELRFVSLEIRIGESESAVIARIGKACDCDVPEFLEI